MNRCPNCGSTAQVRLVWQDLGLLFQQHCKKFKCGCGCRFVAIYELTDIKVLNKDDGDT